MSTLDHSSNRRQLPVCLRDIRLDVRMRAAHEASRREADDATRALILFAALAPSDCVYYVEASAEPVLLASLERAA